MEFQGAMASSPKGQSRSPCYLLHNALHILKQSSYNVVADNQTQDTISHHSQHAARNDEQGQLQEVQLYMQWVQAIPDNKCV